ncbi:permease prefix domain 1-containing protein [Sporosarcina cascadiensis]|uniref:permease prefix domain 1-containing protein n=1 Tax=Sporosarcina cascadiensis TaxID=2660747 RepID=UPI00129A7E2F|nr:permease prefix domain 1-containing protein [Sporosarcina cascadiensis]
MSEVFERFVKGIVRQTDSNQEERNDLSEELLSHLQCAFEDLHNQGYSKEEAVQMAMLNFGDDKEVGKQLQQAMYPYRREMMLILSSASLIFAYSVYALQLFTRGDAHMIWLLLAVIVSAFILTVTLRPVQSMNRRLWMNGLLLSHIAVFAAGSLLAADLDLSYSAVLSIFSYAIVLLSIILVYRTTIYDFPSSKQSLQKHAKWIHFINITIGIILTFITLFFVWAIMLFAGEMNAVFLVILIPLIFWGIFYMVQLKLLALKLKAPAYAVAFFEILLVGAAAGIWLFRTFGLTGM